MPSRKPEGFIPYHITQEDRSWLSSIGIIEDVVPLVLPEKVKAEPMQTLEPTPGRVLRKISDAPKSMELQELIEAFGEEVMPMLLEMMKGKLVKCWGPFFNKFYILPDAKEKVERMLLESGE